MSIKRNLTRVVPVAVALGAIACSSTSSEGSPTTATAPDAEAVTPEQFFLDAIAKPTVAFSSAELMPNYDKLQPVTIDGMIGTWKGGKFNGNKPDPIHWWGKKVVSPDLVLGFLCTEPDGGIYSWDVLGLAKMAEADFHGTTSASIVYNNGFLQDYFRRVTDDVLIGYSSRNYDGSGPLVFYLQRAPNIDVAP